MFVTASPVQCMTVRVGPVTVLKKTELSEPSTGRNTGSVTFAHIEAENLYFLSTLLK